MELASLLVHDNQNAIHTQSVCILHGGVNVALVLGNTVKEDSSE